MKCGDTIAFQKFALQVQSLVGLLKTLGPESDIELNCGSHVACLLSKLPSDQRAEFCQPGTVPTLLFFSFFLFLLFFSSSSLLLFCIWSRSVSHILSVSALAWPFVVEKNKESVFKRQQKQYKEILFERSNLYQRKLKAARKCIYLSH